MDLVNTSQASGNVSDEFVFSNPAPTLVMCSLYMILGTCAIFSNILDITIFLTNHELRRRFIFFIALDVGELIDGLCYVLTSIGRGYGVLSGTFAIPISYHDCFFRILLDKNECAIHEIHISG
uniref:G_PROTEIN_RECEP_F1_2 domain-containing protein n=1 Tax=Steinernema glaseri TaxID=37863 RepID=A0A1I7ZSK8_9BILA